MTLSANIEEWLSNNPSALVLKEYLIPVEGKNSPFFPPTFAGTGSDDSGYCIDVLKDATRTCLVDTVGSQANRMEPIFMHKPYNELIPQITITAESKKVNLCEVGHRAADALLRHSEIYQDIQNAFRSLQKDNDAIPLAKLAPTSLVFGIWDSRGTQVKMPRIVSSTIRAYDIDELRRSAQYFPPVDYRAEELLGDYKDGKEKDNRSSLGFNESPATNTHGGIIAHGDIVRDVIINLASLRKINTSDEKVEKLQKYILSLSMIAASSIREWDLRQGCLLTRDPERDIPTWNIVHPDGKRKDVDVNHEEILKYAQDIAKEFGVGENRSIKFNKDTAEKEIKSHKDKK